MTKQNCYYTNDIGVVWLSHWWSISASVRSVTTYCSCKIRILNSASMNFNKLGKLSRHSKSVFFKKKYIYSWVNIHSKWWFMKTKNISTHSILSHFSLTITLYDSSFYYFYLTSSHLTLVIDTPWYPPNFFYSFIFCITFDLITLLLYNLMKGVSKDYRRCQEDYKIFSVNKTFP